jgi:hypothetical protein
VGLALVADQGDEFLGDGRVLGDERRWHVEGVEGVDIPGLATRGSRTTTFSVPGSAALGTTSVV